MKKILLPLACLYLCAFAAPVVAQVNDDPFACDPFFDTCRKKGEDRLFKEKEPDNDDKVINVKPQKAFEPRGWFDHIPKGETLGDIQKRQLEQIR